MDIRLKKRLGQYFLRDRSALSRIIDALELEPQDTVLEIGAGTGVLTFPVAEKVKEVIAVEIDPRLCSLLKKDNITVLQEDFLKMDLSGLPASTKVVSNLPYYITTPIITKIAVNRKFDFMVLTMQEEVARRIAAGPGSKEYGSISVLVQFYNDVEIVAFVSKKSFFPVPKVDSCIVKFRKRELPKLACPSDFLFKVVRRGFSSRRKMLRNTLKVFGQLDNISIDLTRRPETLGIDEFCKLAGELWQRSRRQKV